MLAAVTTDRERDIEPPSPQVIVQEDHAFQLDKTQSLQLGRYAEHLPENAVTGQGIPPKLAASMIYLERLVTP